MKNKNKKEAAPDTNKFQKFGMTKSKMEKYLRCPFSYDCHYNKKIRPVKTGSALMFGIGIDEALNHILEKKPVKDAMEVFKRAISGFEANKITYGKYDYDKYLLSLDQKKEALAYCKKIGYKGDNVDDLWNELCEKDKLNSKHEKAMDYLGRLSLTAKAEIMLNAYVKQIMPRIKKVHAVQKTSEKGIVDLIADFDKKGDTYIIDNKTSSQEYGEDDAEYSVQLIGYATQENISKVMFIVIPKKIDKEFKKECRECGYIGEGRHKTCDNMIDDERCGGEWKTTIEMKCEIQIVKGEVTEQMKLRAQEIENSITKSVESKNFPCNFANCSNQFGKPCEYRGLYWKGDMTGLEDQTKGKK